MRPHARSIVGADGPPPPPKPLPPLPPTSNTSSKPSLTASPPVKRKPLPANAFSPQSSSPSSGSPNQEREELERSVIALASATTLHRVLGSQGEQRHDMPRKPPQNAQAFGPGAPSPQTPVLINNSALPDRLRVVKSNEDSEHSVNQEAMAIGPGDRPPPLRTDSTKTLNAKKQSPGNKFTSFFSRKPVTSPGAESTSTEISDSRSPVTSPHPSSEQGSGRNAYFTFAGSKGLPMSPSNESLNHKTSFSNGGRDPNDWMNRYTLLEAELREISVELAGSIRRELDLEDLVERLQSGEPEDELITDRTSDYFSDSGASSHRAPGSESGTKEEIDKVKREAEQAKASLRVDLSQKWQEEAAQRKALESHVQMLEGQLSQARRNNVQVADATARVKELENSLDDARRRLNEERKVKENFEDLLSALRVELEQSRSQSSPRLQQELQNLRDENAALKSAREMERGMQRGSMQFISEEGDVTSSPRSTRFGGFGGMNRSNTVTAGRGSRNLSRSNSISGRGQPETIENAVEKMKTFEQQRDALHTAVKYLVRRQEQQQKQFDKRVRMLQTEIERSSNNGGPRKGGYEREVRVLRAEINTLRKRADDALEQKWQCEKGLAGLKMDLDRNKQETASLQRLLQAKGSDPDSSELTSATLENAIVELQKERARVQESKAQIEHEEHLAEQLEESAARSEALAAQVRKQVHSNQMLRARLKSAVESGEQNQTSSASQINKLQAKLRRLEESITAAQIQSETAVMKHEEEVRVMKASNNSQLMRGTASKRQSSNLLSPQLRTPISPMFNTGKRSPRLDKTSSGPGVALHEALRTEFLEKKVTDLEKALADAEREMGQVVGRMNTAQISVAELESERDEALRQTRKLEAAVREEQGRYRLMTSSLKAR